MAREQRPLSPIPAFVWALAVVVLALAAIACGVSALYLWQLRTFPGGASPTPIIWTATPAPTLPPSPTPTETPVPTPTASPEIAIGRYVQVSGTEGAGVSLRQEPDVNSARVGIGYEGEVFIVISGPRSFGGYTWWLIRDPADEARQGWAVANYLQPVDW